MVLTWFITHCLSNNRRNGHWTFIVVLKKRHLARKKAGKQIIFLHFDILFNFLLVPRNVCNSHHSLTNHPSIYSSTRPLRIHPSIHMTSSIQPDQSSRIHPSDTLFVAGLQSFVHQLDILALSKSAGRLLTACVTPMYSPPGIGSA